MRKGQILGISLILVMLLAACAPVAAPAPAAPAAPAKAAWEAEWEKVLAAAKAEGKLIAYTTGSAGEREAMMREIKRLYGISAEVTNMMPRELTPKMAAERKAGLYLNDIYVGGYKSLLLQWKPDGWIQPFDDALIHADVSDPERIKKVWYRGQLGWVDKEHTIMVTTLQPGFPLAINTNLVKEGELKSYRDLLNPKWKAKIAVGDPILPGGPNEVWSAMMVIMGEDFMRELAKTELTVQRDQRLVLDWLAQGKVAIVIASDSDTVIDFEKAGAPVKGFTPPAEGGYISASASGLARFDKPAHPNAAKVFINWITSKEGQEAYVLGGMYHSLRLDVSTAHLHSGRQRRPDVKYLDVSSAEAKLKNEQRGADLAKEVLGPLMKK